MDIKSMAKSKRSHTQHHQPKKPPKTTSSSSSATSTSTAAKKDGRERKKASLPTPSLPSNWDRYEDENLEDEIEVVRFHSDSYQPSPLADSESKSAVDVDIDVFKPKSKGADFRDLIAQAKESRSYHSPSFDDKLPEFYQGAAPMFAVRGEKIILQDRDDDFLMECEVSGTEEVPFLTLDLEDIAERLSKVDIAKRLFIEPDLFPPELRGQESNKADNQVPFQIDERRKMERVDSFGELLALYLHEEQMAKRQEDIDRDGMITTSIAQDHYDPDQESESSVDLKQSKLNAFGYIDARETVQIKYDSKKEAKSNLDYTGQVSHVTEQVTKSKLVDLDFVDEREKPQITDVAEPDRRPTSRFEAASAETELDMLLGSLNDTKLFDTPMNQPGTSAYKMEDIAVDGALSKHSSGQSASLCPLTSTLDDELDDLLAETTKADNKDGLSQFTQVQSSSLSQPSSKSKVLEDFSLWLDTI
ncbi:hypothetical protein BVRB_9g209490 isoform A [Beta vulgaris subsp. vulgaris]|nr:hypothetical protein BVRB_9g209490 isoform A [Beta vulgaris subsp. vulgaris]